MRYTVFWFPIIIALSILLFLSSVAATSYSESDPEIRSAQVWVTYRQKCDLTCYVETHYYLAGEVVNVRNEPVSARLSVILYDERGNLFYNKEFAPFLAGIMPNGTRNSISPFKIDLDDLRTFYIIGAKDLESSEEFKMGDNEFPLKYEVKVTTRHYWYEKPAELEVEEIGKFVDNDKNLHILGKVHNIGSGNATNVNVIYTFYNEEGRVVWADKQFLDETKCSSYPAIAGEEDFCFGGLGPDTSVPFELIIRENVAHVIKYWSILAESDTQSTVPEFPSFAVISFAIAVSFAFATRLKPQLRIPVRRID